MLASIQKIISVKPIPNADRIETAKVLGWDCVVRKGLFKPGDLCIYIEIDTVIPKKLLNETYEGDEKERIRTVKMRGQISQGLILPVDILNTFGCKGYEGEDVSEILGVIKYEKQIPPQLMGLAYGSFPSFIPKTEEIRIQSDLSLLDKLRGKEYYITTKLDGTSATFYRYKGHFGVCSRNLELKDGENIYWRMARKYILEEMIPEGYAIQGEICGPAIQKNRLELKEPSLFVFNIFNINKYKYIDEIDFEDALVDGWSPEKIQELFENSKVYEDDYSHIDSVEDLQDWFFDYIGYNNLEFVPEEELGEEFSYSLEELLEKAKGDYKGTKNKKEGIVVRSLDQDVSFKVLNNEFLLENEE